MSIRTRLRNALTALLGEPASPAAASEFAYLRATANRYSLHLDDIRNDLADADIAIPEDDDPELTPRRMVRALIARMGDARRDFDHEERMHGHTIDQRDAARDAADRLAYAIASMEEIGEHSNLNDPWANALEALEERWQLRIAKPAPKVPKARVLAVLRAVDACLESGLHPDRLDIATHVRDCFGFADKRATIARWVSDVAALGYLESDGHKPARYALTSAGRALLAGERAVAS